MNCADCKHWSPCGEYETGHSQGMGSCGATPMFWENTEWNDDGERVVKPTNAHTTAFVQDGSDYSATLYTLPEHGCTMHSPRDVQAIPCTTEQECTRNPACRIESTCKRAAEGVPEVEAPVMVLSMEQKQRIAQRAVGDDPVSQTTAIRVINETLHALALGVKEVETVYDQALREFGDHKDLPPVHIDRERMERALAGPFFTVPNGLTLEQISAFITATADAYEAGRKDGVAGAGACVSVPLEPTQAMLDAADKVLDADPRFIAAAWRAMVGAAGAPEVETQQGGQSNG